MDRPEPTKRVEVRLDPATAADLAALERHLRLNTSSVVRLALAELARRQGVSQTPEADAERQEAAA